MPLKTKRTLGCICLFVCFHGLIYRERRHDGEYVTVPENCVWVEGDNQRSSEDSNKYGPVSGAIVL